MSPPESADVKMGRGEGGRGMSEDTDFVLTTTRDRHIEREDITSYVNRKREMFLVQYALGVKRDEIQKLEDIATVSPTDYYRVEKGYYRTAGIMEHVYVHNICICAYVQVFRCMTTCIVCDPCIH